MLIMQNSRSNNDKKNELWNWFFVIIATTSKTMDDDVDNVEDEVGGDDDFEGNVHSIENDGWEDPS